MSKSHIGYKHTDVAKEKIGRANKILQTGKKASDAARLKMSKSGLARNFKHSDETKKFLSSMAKKRVAIILIVVIF